MEEKKRGDFWGILFHSGEVCRSGKARIVGAVRIGKGPTLVNWIGLMTQPRKQTRKCIRFYFMMILEMSEVGILRVYV